MTGLRHRQRDRELPARAGDADLVPPAEGQLVDWLNEALRAPDGPAIVAAEWDYARWKPATSITCAYRVCFEDGAEEIVGLKRYKDGKHLSLASRSDRPAGPGASERLRPRAILVDRALAVWSLGADRRLPGLDTLLDGRTLSRLLEESGRVPERSIRRRRTQWHVLRYKPERRSVWRLDLSLRCEPSEQSFAARVLPPPACVDATRIRSAFARLGGEEVTSRFVLGDDRRGLLLEEWEDVEPAAPDDFGHAEEAGAALARLHAVPHAPIRRPTETGTRAALLPLFATDARLLRLQQAVVPGERRFEHRWVHGDFHPDQLARERAGGAWRLLDLDALGGGDALQDLASWIADHLIEDGSISADAAAAPLLAGYAHEGARVDSERLAGVVANELVRRSAAFLRRLEADAVHKARAALERASALAAQGVLG